MHHRLPAAAANVTAFYAAPQVPADARRLWDGSCTSSGFDAELTLPIPAGRAYGASLMMAREWEVTDLAARLAEAIEASYEPTWDHDRGEFTWGLGLNEPHPRGQFNAFLAAAEATGPGRWTALSAAPLDRCPQVVDVDFPTVALRRAEWVEGALHLEVAPVHEDPEATTSFRIVGAEPDEWTVDGPEGTTAQTSADGVIVGMPVVSGDIVLRSGGA